VLTVLTLVKLLLLTGIILLVLTLVAAATSRLPRPKRRWREPVADVVSRVRR
jgi:hypothetical protein